MLDFFSESVYKTVLRHSLKELLRGQCFELNTVWGVFISVHIFEQDCNELVFFRCCFPIAKQSRLDL